MDSFNGRVIPLRPAQSSKVKLFSVATVIKVWGQHLRGLDLPPSRPFLQFMDSSTMRSSQLKALILH